MREIKFRARNANVPRCWIYGYFIIEDGHNYIVNEDGQFKVIAGTEGQFTGLHDKNGVEIYEGDILRDKKGGDGVVNYCDNVAAFIVLTKNDIYWLNEGSINRSTKLEYTEVIGNIDENKELLEK